MRPLLIAIISIGFAVFFSGRANAQTWGYAGVKGGANFSDVYFGDTFRPVNMATSFVYGKHLGVVGKLFLAEHAGIQVEATYIEKGYDQLLASGFYTAQMNYLEVPFLLNAYLGKGKSQFFVNMGPYAEFFLSQKETLVGTVAETDEFYPFDPDTDRTAGYGLQASGGINRLFKFGLIQLEGGMGLSLSDMLVSDRLVSEVPDGSKHITGFLSLAYMLPLGKKPEHAKLP